MIPEVSCLNLFIWKLAMIVIYKVSSRR